MAETKRSTPKPEPEYVDGASSSDPAVHQLLAVRQTAAMNGDKAAAEAATAELNKLGYK